MLKEIEAAIFKLLHINADDGWILRLVGVLIAAAFFYFLYKATSILHRRLESRITAFQKSKIRAIKFQNYEFLNEEEVTKAVLIVWKCLGYAVYFIYFYLFLNAVFMFFPRTQELAETLITSFWEVVVSITMGFVNYLPSLFFLVVLYYITKVLLKFTHHFFSGVEQDDIRIRGFYSEWASPTYKLIRLLIIVFMMVIAFPYLPGSDSPAFKGISLFLGVLLSLGSSATVANVVSGVMLTYMRAFNIGDRVKIADAEGDVVERTLFITRVRTPKNVDITIPNLMVLNNHIINYSTQAETQGVRLHTTVTIGYDQPWELIQGLLVDAAKKTDGLDHDIRPFVLQTKLDDFYVHYELNAITRRPNEMAKIYSDLHCNILDTFHAGGVEIASPHLGQMRDGNDTNMPDEYLPKDYQPGSFKVFPFNTGGGKD